MANSTRDDLSVLSENGLQICIIGNKLKENADFMEAVQHFNLPIVYSVDGEDVSEESSECKMTYILDEFEGETFERLFKANQRILGPTVVIQCAQNDKPLPNNTRPLYTASMKDQIVSFSGFRSKDYLSKLVSLVHHMGGSVRQNFSFTKTTHLVATASAKNTSEKYKYAVSISIPTMTEEWVFNAWSKRHDVGYVANDQESLKYKLLPFVGNVLAFIGFEEDEKEHIAEIAQQNGASVVEDSDPSWSHLIVEDGYIVDYKKYPSQSFILRKEWFWNSVVIEAKAEENLYIFTNDLNSAILTSSTVMPTGGNKRKRLESVAHQLALESLPEIENFNNELRKKADPKLSISGLDAAFSPERSLEKALDDLDKKMKSPPTLPDFRTFTPRQQVVLELFQTESNYVSILETIMQVFKDPLEHPDSVESQLLAPAEVKLIFGNLEPIFVIHKTLKVQLIEHINKWSDEKGVGHIILSHAEDFKKAYPPYINYYEKTKAVLINCDNTKPRFHAFLKKCQSKPECRRQTLLELLIRPVQRLPSVILLLNDILKRTSVKNPDYKALEDAIASLKSVLTHLNESRRTAEGQLEMFDIMNDIENCPPNFLSATRQLIAKLDVHEHTDLLNKKPGPYTVFFFSDMLEICKKRNKGQSSSLRSPSVSNLASSSGTLSRGPYTKSYKHIDMINVIDIKRVVNVIETEEFRNIFALVCWSQKESKELLYIFVLVDGMEKSVFLKHLCQSISKIVCTIDPDSVLTTLEPHQIDLHSSDNSGNALTKALNKTKHKLGRALSMRKTPLKRGLSRAISTIISPGMAFANHGHSNSTTRLASITNLSETDSASSSLAPSPMLGKKRKSSSFGAAFGKYI